MGIESDCHVSEATPSVAPSRTDDPGNSRGYLACKSAIDAILAVGLFILTFPFMLVAMALMKLTSRGPAIYCQTRVGHHGRPFTIYKIRTMVQDSERLTGPSGPPPATPGSRRSAGSSAPPTWTNSPSSGTCSGGR